MRRVTCGLVALVVAGCASDPTSTTIDAGDITSGTLGVERLPDAVLLEGEIAQIDPTTDAGDLTSGTLDASRLPGEAVLFSDLDDAGNLPAEVVLESELPTVKPSGVAGAQVQGFATPVAIDGTTFLPLTSATVGAGEAVDVALVAHAYLEKPAAGSGRYEIAIREGTCAGSSVGSTLWRPPVPASGTFVADAVTLTGFATGVSDGTVFVLCAAKFDPGAPDLNVGHRGLIATW